MEKAENISNLNYSAKGPDHWDIIWDNIISCLPHKGDRIPLPTKELGLELEKNQLRRKGQRQIMAYKLHREIKITSLPAYCINIPLARHN